MRGSGDIVRDGGLEEVVEQPTGGYSGARQRVFAGSPIRDGSGCTLTRGPERLWPQPSGTELSGLSAHCTLS